MGVTWDFRSVIRPLLLVLNIVRLVCFFLFSPFSLFSPLLSMARLSWAPELLSG